jgi:TrmH family RNA methyltransferase
LRARLDQSRVEIAELSEKDFRSAAETESPQGVIAIGEVPSRSLDTLQISDVCRILVLDAVQDPGNVGTIVRTAAALGATATVALPGTVDLWNPKVIRSSMGAQFHHFALHAEWAGLLGLLGRESIELWAADAQGEPLDKTRAVKRVAIVVGNEGSGLSPDVRARADRTISLPIADSVESLNVAVAAGIILHELRP